MYVCGPKKPLYPRYAEAKIKVVKKLLAISIAHRLNQMCVLKVKLIEQIKSYSFHR